MKPLAWMCGLGLLAVMVLVVAPASAATITWVGPTNVSADSDVVNSGTFVGAYDLSNNSSGPQSLAVNGVTFSLWTVMGTAKTSNGVTFTWTGAISGQADRQSIPTGGGIGANYARLMGSFGGVDGSTNTSTLTLSGLTNGEQYTFQVWCTDPINSDRRTLVDGSVTLKNNNTPTVSGGIGQYATGTFTASGTTQAIVFSNGAGDSWTGHNVSALQLRLVPEPATMALLAFGGVSLLLKRRRR